MLFFHEWLERMNSHRNFAFKHNHKPYSCKNDIVYA